MSEAAELEPPEPVARSADHWDAMWAVSEPGCHALLARTRFTLDAEPHAARAWLCAAGLWQSHPLGWHSATPQPPLCLLTLNGTSLDLPQRMLVRGEAFAVDLADELLAGANDLVLEAVYPDPPSLVGMPMPASIAVFCQMDVDAPGQPLVRIATGRRETLARIVPFRLALPSSSWETLVKRTPGSRWEAAEPRFLHPLAASPLLRFPRRGGSLEREADRDVPRVRHARRAAQRETVAPRGSLLLDFGEELVGHLAVTVDGPAVLTVSPGESEPEARDLVHRTENPLRTATLSAAGTWRDPRRSALRWVLVRNDGDAASAVEVALDAFEADLAPSGQFRCADPLLERIWTVGRHTVLRCTHDHVEDGPKRDRLLWLGDLAATADTFGLAFGDLGPFRRSLLLLAANQLRSGAVPGVGPHPNDLVVADYVPHFVRAAERLLALGGDRRTGMLLLAPVSRALAFLGERIGAEGLVGPEEETDWWVFLDWERRDAFGCPVERQGCVTALSLLAADAFRAGARLAAHLDRHGDAERWRAQADLLLERVVERCFEEDPRGLAVDWVRGGERSRHVSRLTQAWAILVGVGTAAQHQAMLDALASRTGRLGPTTTGLGQLANVEALFRGGRAEAALALVRRWWGGMLERGATTFWESFDPDEGRDTELDLYGRRYGTSLCHAWSGAVAGALSRHVLGVEPRVPGWARVTIAPCLGDLAWAEGVVPTPRGPIAVRWHGEGGEIELPPGVEAHVGHHGAARVLGPGRHRLP